MRRPPICIHIACIGDGWDGIVEDNCIHPEQKTGTRPTTQTLERVGRRRLRTRRLGVQSNTRGEGVTRGGGYTVPRLRTRRLGIQSDTRELESRVAYLIFTHADRATFARKHLIRARRTHTHIYGRVHTHIYIYMDV